MSPVVPTSADRRRRMLLFHLGRVQAPRLALSPAKFDENLDRTFEILRAKSETPLTWENYLNGLYLVDWLVAIGCLEGNRTAWDMLFAARTGRSDCLLVDALRARAVRLYPRDAERQETAVTEFWSSLLAAENETSKPVLARYDGQRPLPPWLIRVFQNWHLSKLRSSRGAVALPEDDLAAPLPPRPPEEERWHEAFALAARQWLNSLSDQERILLGLRWRYRLSQRDVATVLGVHEGTISRQTDKLRDRGLEVIGQRLVKKGWTGDDLESFILTELAAVLTDDPKLSVDHLKKLLNQQGKSAPSEQSPLA